MSQETLTNSLGKKLLRDAKFKDDRNVEIIGDFSSSYDNNALKN